MTDLEMQFKEHLDGFHERRKQTDKFQGQTERYHRENTKRLTDMNKILETQNKALERIERQTTLTNGRVNKIEETCEILTSDQQKLQNWKSFMLGGMAILGMMFIPLLFKFLDV